MCGVYLRYSFSENTFSKEFDQGLLEKSRHRGPDETLIEFFGSAVIGFNRLAIRSVVSGTQPYRSKNASFVSCFNGELYNSESVSSELISREGISEIPTGDMQILPEYIAEFGNERIVNLEGMFAGFIYFIDRNELLLVRDKAGEKPIYYSHQGGQLYVASEVHSIPNPVLADVKSNIQEYSTGVWEGSKTPFQNVSKVPPGSYVLINLSTLSFEERTYWQWGTSSSRLKKSQKKHLTVQEELKVALQESVNKQLISDFPVCAFLSGGLDSAGILASMNQMQRRNVKTFTLDFEERSYSESYLAGLSSSFLGMTNEKVPLSASDIAELIPKVIDSMDIPIFDPACLGIYALSRASGQQGFKVALTGDGGDELFRGYKIYGYTNILCKLNLIPSLSKLLLSLFTKTTKSNSKYLSWNMLALRALDVVSHPEMTIPEVALSPFSGSPILGLWNSDNAAKPRQKISRFQLDQEFESYYRRSILPEIYLAKSDRMGMSNSLEIRNPFLDSKMLDLVKYMELTNVRVPHKKELMQFILGSNFPKDVLNAPKHGFGIPLTKALKKLREPDWMIEDLGITRKVASSIWLKAVSGDESLSHAVWGLLVLDNFVKRRATVLGDMDNC
jgi:asparagine synthase (glutamine-hydrolysing)